LIGVQNVEDTGGRAIEEVIGKNGPFQQAGIFPNKVGGGFKDFFHYVDPIFG
jgi:hypothetical protein